MLTQNPENIFIVTAECKLILHGIVFVFMLQPVGYYLWQPLGRLNTTLKILLCFHICFRIKNKLYRNTFQSFLLTNLGSHVAFQTWFAYTNFLNIKTSTHNHKFLRKISILVLDVSTSRFGCYFGI